MIAGKRKRNDSAPVRFPKPKSEFQNLDFKKPITQNTKEGESKEKKAQGGEVVVGRSRVEHGQPTAILRYAHLGSLNMRTAA